jgi:molecular chaperone GrpE
MSKPKDNKQVNDQVSADALKPENTELESVKAELEALKQQYDQGVEQLALADSKYKAAVAEQHNIQKRADREIDKVRQFSLERFASGLLPVADSLEKAIEAFEVDKGNNVQHMQEGVKLVYSSLLEVFGRFNVVKHDAINQPFDPEKMEAISSVKAADGQADCVTQVVQTGYSLGERTLRPSLVIVAKEDS